MSSTDDTERTTQVVVYEARRLIRQALSIWLSGQEDVAPAGTASSAAAVAQLCDRQDIDVVLVGLVHDFERVLHETQGLAERYQRVRFIGITNDAQQADQVLANGFRAVVNASAGAANLLRVIRAGAVETPINSPVQTFNNTGPLTPREAEVLSLVSQGSTADDISDQLGISPSTIANHKERIYNKLEVNNQAHAVAVAVSSGIITPARDGDTTGDEITVEDEVTVEEGDD